MMRREHFARAPVLAFILTLTLLLGCGEVELPPPFPAQPAFTLERLQGGAVSLADYQGRPVLVDFWATWCPPCVKQIPLLNAFHEAQGARFPVLGVATDASGIKVVAPFATEHGIAYTVLIGDQRLAQQWRVPGYPTLYLLRPDGTIADWHVGPISEAGLRELTADWID